MNLKSKPKIKRRATFGALALCTLLSVQLIVLGGQKKRSGAEIAVACFKKMPGASPVQINGFIIGACDSQHHKDKVKFRACVQNAQRKIKELNAKKR